MGVDDAVSASEKKPPGPPLWILDDSPPRPPEKFEVERLQKERRFTVVSKGRRSKATVLEGRNVTGVQERGWGWGFRIRRVMALSSGGWVCETGP